MHSVISPSYVIHFHMTILYTLVEIRPDGTRHRMYLGTQLRDGTRTDYTVHGAIAYKYKQMWEEEFPEYTYEMEMERI